MVLAGGLVPAGTTLVTPGLNHTVRNLTVHLTSFIFDSMNIAGSRGEQDSTSISSES